MSSAWRILLLLLGLAFPSIATATPYGKTELLRDRWGVPHVFAETDAGAMYGLGWATAEDRAFQMHYNLRILQGRLAELIGDVKVGATEQRPEGSNSALRSDVKMRVTGFYRAAQQVARHLDRPTLALLQAYSDGVNDYLAQHRKERLYLFDRLSLDPEPWTPADCIASWWRLGQFFAGDGLRDMEGWYGRQAAPPNIKPDDAASVIQRGDVSGRWVAAVQDYAVRHGLVPRPGSGKPPASAAREEGPRFSHAWGVGGKVSTTGSAVLVSDPQTPVRNPSLLYEFHVAGQSFNARGVGVAGSPILLIGFTPDVAWGMTALGADQADLFVLKTDPDRPDQYLFDGKWLRMATRRETIRVKGGEPRTLVVRETRFGPVVTELALGVRSGDEVALKRVPLCETGRETIQGALAMLRARDVKAFRRALRGWRFPSANCVFGDRQGSIGYMTALALPVRSKRALAGGNAAHEGWRSDADWQGMLPADLLPQVVNPARGWIVSANHRPIASFYPLSLGISTGSLGDTDRSWRLKERLAARKRFAPHDVLDIQSDTVSSVKRDLVRLGYHLRDTLKAPLEEETRLALQYLEPWRDRGSRLEMSVPGTEILNLMPLAFRQNFAAARVYGGGLSGLCQMLKTIDARLAEDPRAPLREEEVEYVNLILRAAWRYGKASFGEDPSRWNERGREQLRETRLGYMETLDGFPSLDPSQDVTLPDLKCVDGGTILSQRAQSYTQYVPLHDADEALALLPIGESEHPGSPARLSGYTLWAKGELRPAPLSRARVEPYVVSHELLVQEPPRSRGRRPDGYYGRRWSASQSGRRSGWPTANIGSTQAHGLQH